MLQKLKQAVGKWAGIDSMGFTGRFNLKCYDKAGNLKWDTGWIKNSTTHAGSAVLAGLMGNVGGLAAFTYLAVGTSTTAASTSQTALGAEITDTGLARAQGTASRVTTSQTNDTLQVTYTWTASGSKTVEEIGLFNASSSGTMAARGLTTSKALANTDQLIGTYQVKFTAS